jgi:nicotinamidase-related amidase
MPISQLDEKAALIIFDQQKYNLALDADWVFPLPDVIDRTVKLAEAFRRRGWLVVNVKVPNAYGIKKMNEGTQPGGRVERGFNRPPGRAEDWLSADWHDFVPELQPHPEDLVIVKPMWDSFIGTSLDYDLHQHGVTQVFVTGLITHVGVESTARTAWNYGYNTVTITDAMTDFDKDAHHHSVEKVFPRISERTTTEETLKLIA